MLVVAEECFDYFPSIVQIHLRYATDLFFILLAAQIQGKWKEGMTVLVKKP